MQRLRYLPFCLILFALTTVPAARGAAGPTPLLPQIFLPLVAGRAAPRPSIGVVVSREPTAIVSDYADDLNLGWVFTGDILWDKVEPVRGGELDWSSAASVEANIRRAHASGAEAVITVQRTPFWAQDGNGRLCSPPQSQYYADLAAFAQRVAERYRSGDLRVAVIQFWNEPDFSRQEVGDTSGIGCWGSKDPPYFGGIDYGYALRFFHDGAKRGNPDVKVAAGVLAHFWPDDTRSLGFVRGMIRSGGADAFDLLSYHGYGMGNEPVDRIVGKGLNLQRVLAEEGAADTPVFATEVGATCFESYCPPNAAAYQSGYGARVYAESIALGLYGAIWYTLAEPGSGFLFSHLLQERGDQVTPRPAYYGLRNSAALLNGATYIGPPLATMTFSGLDTPHALRFARPGGEVWVVWIQRTSGSVSYDLAVPPGTRAVCTEQLGQPEPAVRGCSDADGDGVIRLTVSTEPVYVQTFP